MNKPYVICHMTASIDGKVTGKFLEDPRCEDAIDLYYEINREFAADAYACGRITMEGSFTGGWYPDLTEFTDADIPKEDHIAAQKGGFYAVAFDRRGRLGWKTDCIIDEDPGYGGAHIIEVLCEDAPAPYLAYLRQIGVSYIFAGEREMNLPLALEKLTRFFGIEKLLLEGGSVLNGAFQREDLIDELSLVIAPMAGSAGDKPLFDNSTLDGYTLQKSKISDNGVVWLNYTK